MAKTNRFRIRHAVTGILTTLLLQAGMTLPVFAQEVHRFDIDTTDAVTAIHEFGNQAGVQILAAAEALSGKQLNKISGDLSTDDGFQKLLAGTGLSHRYVGERAVALVSESAAAGTESTGTESAPQTPNGDSARKAGFWGRFRLAQNDSTQNAKKTDSPTQDKPNESSRPDSARNTTDSTVDTELGEIIVTGTNIKGIAPVGTDVLVIDRKEIEKLGVGTAQDIVRVLPQNFGGGVGGEDRLIVAGGTPINLSGGAGVNLRGLGGDSTLVLVNGRRVPQGAAPSGQFVDVSSIPHAAIERVEVFLDGASALYGSDAIAGVVNFVLRDDYQGAETRVRYGAVTEGSLDERQFSHVFGRNFGRGSILAGYEYYDRSQLPASEREYASDSDLTRYGGPVAGNINSNPGNITSVIFADDSSQAVQYAIPEGQDGTNLQPEDLIQGATNFNNSGEGLWLLADQRRHSAFGSGRFELTDGIELFGDLRYTQRDFETHASGEGFSNLLVPNTNPYFVSPVPDAVAIEMRYNVVGDFGGQQTTGDVETLNTVLGLQADLGSDWDAEVYAGYGRETTTDHARALHTDRFAEALGVDDPATGFNPAVDGHFNPFGDGPGATPAVLEYITGFEDTKQEIDLWSARALVNGQLFELPGGALRMAVGAEYRDEGRTRRRTSFTSGLEPADVSPQELGRDVTAVFGELYLPAFGQANRRPGFEELALSIAGRSERYSDFGSSTDPRVGLAWAPVEGLRLRGTYGTSFRAPNLTDFGSDYSAALFAVVDPTNTVTGRTLALTLQGPRDDLTPETSTSWTAGVELLPGFASGLQIKATYFDIDFENRVSRLPGNPFNALTQEEALASVITRNPDASLVEALATDAARFRDYSGGAPLSDVRVIIDARISNIAVTRISGVDFIAQYRHASHAGDFDFGLNLTYLKEYRQAITPTAPLVDFRDTLNNPIALRGRANVGWSRGNWSTTAFVNYADSYRNNTFDPERKIDSWTTLDLHLRYDLDGWGDVLRGTALSLNVQNLFDENPPLALDAAAPNVSAGLAYDSENADPLGRFVALQISKTW